MRHAPQRIEYFRSIAAELDSQASRVRKLIGDAHWLSDGHHKEELLRVVLERHVPGGMLVSRGFVVDPNDENRCSSEQDILIVDAMTEAPLFNQGGLLVAFPATVTAAISVKTQMRAKEMRDAICGLATVRDVAVDDPRGSDMWCGVFFWVFSRICGRF